MAQLVTINQLLRGYAPSIAGIKRLLPADTREFTLLDVGCGSGDTLRTIAKWARRRGIHARLFGIELSPVLAERAANLCRDYPEITIEHCDLFSMQNTRNYDIVHCALMLHHFPEDQQVAQAIATMRELARVGIIVNDLHRHWFAYTSIAALTRAFSDSFIIKNDGPLSVARAFTRGELTELACQAGLSNARLEWRWAFRWLLTATVS
jgi:2-polyprenyl-3-methyl-5-hydroxy-6-metoxy-1,4-benzoquinol methylase